MRMSVGRRLLLWTTIIVALLVAGVIGLSWWWARPDYLYRSAQDYVRRAEAARQANDSAGALRVYEFADQQLRRLLAKAPRYDSGHLLRGQVLTRLSDLYAQEETRLGDTSSERRSLLLARAALQCKLQSAADPHDEEAQAAVLAHFVGDNQLQRAAPFAANLVQARPGQPALEQARSDAHYVLAWAALHANPSDQNLALEHLRATERTWRMAGLEARALRLKIERATWARGSSAERADRQALRTSLTGWVDRARREMESLSSLCRADARGLLDLLSQSVTDAEDATQVLDRARLAVTAAEQLSSGQHSGADLLPDVVRRLLGLTDELRRLPSALRPGSEARLALEARMEKIALHTLDAGVVLPAVLWQRLAARSVSGGRPDAALRFAEKGLQVLAPSAKDGDENQRRRVELALHAELARTLLCLGRSQEAESHLVPLRSERTHFAGVAHLLQGGDALHSGRLEEAAREFQDAAAILTPEENFSARFGLANALLGLGKAHQACKVLERLRAQLDRDDLPSPARRAAVGETQRNALYLTLFCCYLAQDQLDKALPLRDLLPAQPERLTAHLLLVEHHLRTSQVRQAAGQVARAGEAFAAAHRELQAARLLAPDDGQLISAEVHWLLRRSEMLPGQVTADMALSADSLSRLLERLESPRPGDVACLPGRSSDLRPNERAALCDYLRGLRALVKGEYRLAVQAFERALSCPLVQGPSERELLGSLLSLSTRESPKTARALASELVHRHPDEPILLLACAATALQLGEIQGDRGAEGALKSLTEVLRRQKKDPAIGLCLAGWGWLSAGRPELARRELEQALRENPRHGPSLWLAGQAALATEDWDACLHFADVLEYVEPGLAEPLLWRGLALDRLGDPRGARKVYEVLIEKHPQLSSGFQRLIPLLAKDREYAVALRLVERWQERFPNEVGALQAQARLLAETGQVGQAEARYREVQGAGILAIARGFLEGGAAHRAEAWAQRALAAAEHTTPADEAGILSARLLLGDIYQVRLVQEAPAARRGLVDRAVAQFEAILHRASDQWIAANNLAWLLDRERGEAEKGFRLLQRVRQSRRARELLPGDRLPVELLMTAGIVYCDAGHFQEAVTLLREGIGRYPNDPRLHLRLGRAYAGLRQHADAQRSLETAIRLASARANRASDPGRRAQWEGVADEARRAHRTIAALAR